jgi:hypothetical protein
LSRIKKTDVQLYQDETGRDSVRGAFGIPSGFLYTSSGVLRELPKDSGRIPEGFPKKTIKKQET